MPIKIRQLYTKLISQTYQNILRHLLKSSLHFYKHPLDIYSTSFVIHSLSMSHDISVLKQQSKTLRKISYEDKILYKQTYLQQFRILQNEPTNNFINLLLESLQTNIELTIIECIKALSNALTTKCKLELLERAHLFLSKILKLIQQTADEVKLQDQIKVLIRLLSLGNINAECTKIILEQGVPIILNKIKNQENSIEIQMELIELLCCMTIGNTQIRDEYIKKGTVDVLLELYYICKQGYISIVLKTIIYGLIVLCFGDPSPRNQKINQAIKIITEYLSTNPVLVRKSEKKEYEIFRAYYWFIYRFYNYKDEEVCLNILQILFKRSLYRDVSDKNTIEDPLTFIFSQIYEYYHQKSERNELTHKIISILHAGCYKNYNFFSQASQLTVFRFYTIQMYEKLFEEAVKHQIERLNLALKQVFQKALIIFMKQKDVEDMERVLIFILWVIRQLYLRFTLSEDVMKSYYQPLIQEKSTLMLMRHNSNRNIHNMAKKLMKMLKQMRRMTYAKYVN